MTGDGHHGRRDALHGVLGRRVAHRRTGRHGSGRIGDAQHGVHHGRLVRLLPGRGESVDQTVLTRGGGNRLRSQLLQHVGRADHVVTVEIGHDEFLSTSHGPRTKSAMCCASETAPAAGLPATPSDGRGVVGYLPASRSDGLTTGHGGGVALVVLVVPASAPVLLASPVLPQPATISEQTARAPNVMPRRITSPVTHSVTSNLVGHPPGSRVTPRTAVFSCVPRVGLERKWQYLTTDDGVNRALDDFFMRPIHLSRPQTKGIAMAHTWSPHLPALHAPAIPRWWTNTTHAIGSSVHHTFANRADRPHEPPRPHPKHYEYLEAGCMARAMEHL